MASNESPSFADLGLSHDLIEVLKTKSITHPLPIQASTIPDALKGRDISGKAPTGSGKTLAFSLPLVSHIKKSKPKRPSGLVLAPTRELANQIAKDLIPLAKTKGLFVHAFYGGAGYGPQIKALERRVDIAVACPGRLEDLLQSGYLTLEDVAFVVIDEADRMADMGFLPSVKRILNQTNKKRQTFLFSATLDGAVDALVRDYQNDPVIHEFMPEDDETGTMTHKFVYLTPDARVDRTAEAISEHGSSVVFVRTRHGADRLSKQLSHHGIRAAAIHGDRSQAQRERALKSFSKGEVQALIATDVVARGIHVDAVACVVHYDLPQDSKDYVHRSGRTARAGADGEVVALVIPESNRLAAQIVNQLQLSPQIEGTQPEIRPRPQKPRSGGASHRGSGHSHSGGGQGGGRPGARGKGGRPGARAGKAGAGGPSARRKGPRKAS
jgi:superfamily II DNA/RNA helicase